MKTIKQILEGKDFEPHMMYDPKTGKEYKAEKPEDHERMKKMGYTHEKPEVKEGAENYTMKKGTYTRKVDGKTADKMKRQGWKLVAREGLEEAVIADVKDIVAKKQAKKIQGVMVDMFTASAISQIYDKVNDGNKAKMDKLKITKLADLAMKLMKREDLEEKRVAPSTRAMRDARKGMSSDPDFKDKRTKDIVATDDDRKAASKNVLMQIRKASDLPKGGEIEFPDSKKKGKISQADAKKVARMFDMLKKPQDKAKFQKIISKDLNAIKGLLKRLGR